MHVFLEIGCTFSGTLKFAAFSISSDINVFAHYFDLIMQQKEMQFKKFNNNLKWNFKRLIMSVQAIN